MKLCKDCDHYRMSINARCFREFWQISPIDGKQLYRPKECLAERATGECGMEAKFFKPIPKPVKEPPNRWFKRWFGHIKDFLYLTLSGQNLMNNKFKQFLSIVIIICGLSIVFYFAIKNANSAIFYKPFMQPAGVAYDIRSIDKSP